MADNGNSNQLIIGDLNSSLKRYLDYMENPNLNLTMEENDTNPRLTTATGWQGINYEFHQPFKKIYKKQDVDDSSESI